MWFPLAALLLAATPTQDDAQKLFQRMEQEVLKCKTFDARIEFAITQFPADEGVKGHLLVARGNKMRWEIDMTVTGIERTVTTISDGQQMRTTKAAERKNNQTPKQLTEIALSSVTRGGVWMTLYIVLESNDPAKEFKDYDPNKSFAVSDFKLGPKEKIAGKEAQIIDFNVNFVGQSLPVTLWIDTRTHLPLKRIVKATPNQIIVTETYTKVTLDEMVDSKQFEMPK